MSGFLLDTNCISELVRIRPDPNVLLWFEHADEQRLHLSALTFGEIRKGLVNMAAGPRYAQLEAWLNVDLRQRSAGQILPVDRAVAEPWGTFDR